MGKITVQNGQKKCLKCLVTKDADRFGYTKDDRYNKRYIDSQCKDCRKLATYAWRKENPLKNKKIASRSREKLKLLVISAYGRGGKPICVECGFADVRALCIDHIFNNGAEERRSLGSKYFAGAIFHRWLRDNNFPQGYQTLCANCNLIKELKRRTNGNNDTA